MHSSSKCLNCNTENDSKFCKECGQSMNTHRLSVGHIIEEVFHYFTHADKGLYFVIKELFIRPGVVIEEYIEGKRKKYFNPFTFLLLCSSISAFIYWKIDYYGNSTIRQDATQTPVEVNHLLVQTSELMEKYGKIITILMIPLLAGIGKLLYFKSNKNYAEHLTIQAFVLAQTSIINIILMLVSYYVFNDYYLVFNMLFQLAYLLYLSIVFSKVFKEHFFVSLLKSIAFIIIFVILYWMIAYSFVSVLNKLT